MTQLRLITQLSHTANHAAATDYATQPHNGLYGHVRVRVVTAISPIWIEVSAIHSPRGISIDGNAHDRPVVTGIGHSHVNY